MKTIIITIFIPCLFLSVVFSCEQNVEKMDYSYQETAYFQEILGCMNMERPVDSYNYPVYPAMTIWANLKTKEEMMEACVVPVERLRKMTTQAVIQSFWEYPFFVECLTRMQWQKDFDSNIDINSYNELISRDDASTELLERYRVMPAACKVLSHPMAFEVLLSQSVFLSKLTDEEKREVVMLAFEKYQMRLENPNCSDRSAKEIICFLIGRVMQNAQYEPFLNEINKNEALELFLETSQYEEPILENIIEHGDQFLK